MPGPDHAALWATDSNGPARQCIKQILRLHQFIDIARGGFELGSYAVRTHELFQRYQERAGIAFTQTLAQAEDIQTSSERELMAGFSYLYGLGVIRVWSLLEVMVEGLVLRQLENQDVVLRSEAVQQLKGPLVEFMTASDAQRAEYLIDRLKDATRADLQLGVGRFEALLSAVALGGGVNDLARRAILEMSQVRHLLVHRLGIVDKRFREACPWLGAQVADSFHVSSNHFRLYSTAAQWYAFEIITRTTDDQDDVAEFRKVMDELLITIETLESDRAASRGLTASAKHEGD